METVRRSLFDRIRFLSRRMVIVIHEYRVFIQFSVDSSVTAEHQRLARMYKTMNRNRSLLARRNGVNGKLRP